MNIAISINKKYVRIAYVMLKSLFMHNEIERFRIFVLNSELESEDLKKLDVLASEYDNEIVGLHIDRSTFPEELPTTELWSIETYFRLMMPQILPQEVDRILYLDVDMVVTGSIKELYDTDISDVEMVVCEDVDPYGEMENFIYRKRNFAELFAEGYRYFNGGVVLWNMEKIRGKYELQDYLDVAKQLNYEIDTVDQDLLNYVHAKSVKYADQKYDYFARTRSNLGDGYEDARQNAVIIHYVSQKPWDANGYHFDIEKIWWEYAKMTPYYSELLEEFLEKTLTDRTIFLDNSRMFQTNRELQQNLNESLELNKKLFLMINGGQQ